MKKSKSTPILILKIVAYTLAIFLAVAGLLSIRKEPIISIILILIAVSIIKLFNWAVKQDKLNKENVIKKDNELAKETIPKTSHINTYIAGVTFKNDKNEEIQKLFENYVSINYDSSNFEDYTNKEIIENNYEIYEFNLVEINTIKLLSEPDNKYDPNAIKVIHKNLGHIGYIPKKETVNIKNFINTEKKIDYTISFKGGKTKFVDTDDNLKDRVFTEKRNYYIDLTITKR